MSETLYHPTFQAPDVVEVARLFPAYEIHRLIACGGMGAVYQASQRSLDRLVAIKILPREFSTDAEFRAGFESEAKAMAKLNHPNLIGVYDFGDAEGLLYIVMEFVDGKSLFESAHGFAVEQLEALSIIIDICRGLTHAHEHGVLHRDIKPSNIFLDVNVSPKIGDFGLARAVERQIEEGEQIFGTPGYTAPEVLEPPFNIDQRADIFSVGVMLHELLTGKLPDADPRPPSQICGCSNRLDAIVARALHPDPNQRFGSAAELAYALENFSSAPPTRTLITSSVLVSARAPSTPGAPNSPSAGMARSPGLVLGGGSRHPVRTTVRIPVKQSSSGPLVAVVLIVAAVAIAVYVFKGDIHMPQDGGAPSVPDAPVLPGERPPANPTPVENPRSNSAADLLNSARISTRHRVEPMMEAQKRDLKANLRDFEAALRKLRNLNTREKKGIRTFIDECESRGNRLPDSLSATLANADGANEILASYLAKQKALDERLISSLKSQSGVYVLGLQNQIEQMTRAGNRDVVQELEAEIRRVESDPGYFSSAMRR